MDSPEMAEAVEGEAEEISALPVRTAETEAAVHMGAVRIHWRPAAPVAAEDSVGKTT